MWSKIAKRRFFLICIIATVQTATFAQSPDWYDADLRSLHYPTHTYFYGFAMNEIDGEQSVESAMERVKAAARVEAVSTIKVYVHSVQKAYEQSNDYTYIQTEYSDFCKRFESQTILSTDIEIPGLKIASYRDGNIIAAFAFVNRQDLQQQLEKQITVGLTCLETQLDIIQELIRQGDKFAARSRVTALNSELEIIERNQELLLAVAPKVNIDRLQLNETKAIKQHITKTNNDLKSGIYIALQVSAQTFGEPYQMLENAIKGELSPIGCSFTMNNNEADWVVEVYSTPRKQNSETFGQYTSYFVYVESQLKIIKNATQQTIYEDALSIKGADTQSEENAARDAYKQTAKKVSAIIKAQITSH